MSLNDRQKRFLIAAFEAQDGVRFNYGAVAVELGWRESEGSDCTTTLQDKGYVRGCGAEYAELSPLGREAAREMIDNGTARKPAFWTEPQQRFCRAAHVCGNRGNHPFKHDKAATQAQLSVQEGTKVRDQLVGRGVLKVQDAKTSFTDDAFCEALDSLNRSTSTAQQPNSSRASTSQSATIEQSIFKDFSTDSAKKELLVLQAAYKRYADQPFIYLGLAVEAGLSPEDKQPVLERLQHRGVFKTRTDGYTLFTDEGYARAQATFEPKPPPDTNPIQAARWRIDNEAEKQDIRERLLMAFYEVQSDNPTAVVNFSQAARLAELSEGEAAEHWTYLASHHFMKGVSGNAAQKTYQGEAEAKRLRTKRGGSKTKPPFRFWPWVGKGLWAASNNRLIAGVLLALLASSGILVIRSCSKSATPSTNDGKAVRPVSRPTTFPVFED